MPELVYEPVDDASPPILLSPHRVIRASAGSGKTHRLAVRYLRLLRAGMEPDRILATTFTRKAAGEVQARVLGRLAAAAIDPEQRSRLEHDLAAGPLSQRECIAMLRRLARSLHRLGIGTIDAFFHRIASAFRTELGLPRDPLVIDDRSATAAELRGRAIEAMLAEAGDEASLRTVAELLRRLHHDAVGRSVTAAIASAVQQCFEAYREAADEHLWSWVRGDGLLAADQLAAVADGVEALREHLPTTKTGSPRKTWANAMESTIEAIRSGVWGPALSKGVLGALIQGKDVFDATQIPEPWRDVGGRLIRHAAAVELALLSFKNRATFELLRNFEQHHMEVCRRERVVSFADIADRLSRVLPTLSGSVQAALYYRLDAGVQHLLLDEFQDTSIAQWRVLGPMVEELVSHAQPVATQERAAGSEGGEGAAEPITDRGLFVVGDVKQAIYGWRGGCAELFDVVEEVMSASNADPSQFTSAGGSSGDGGAVGAVEHLNTSYRSSPAVLAAVNRVFGRLMQCDVWESHDADAEAKAVWASRFEHHTPAGPAATRTGRVTLQTSPAELTPVDSRDFDEFDPLTDDELEVSADTSATQLELHAAQLIQTLSRDHPTWTIGVLTRRNAPVQRLLRLLRARDVDASGESGNPITDRAAVLAVLSALTLAEHPGDSASAFHVINSPLGQAVGLTATNPSPAAASRSIRRELMGHGYAATLARWAREVADHTDAPSRGRLAQLVELAERFDLEAARGASGSESDGPAPSTGLGGEAALRPTRFVRMVETTPVEEPSPARVRVMTIHRAKGLEFDAVVLPELHGRMRDNWPVLLERDDVVGPVTAASRSARRDVRALLPRLEAMYHDRRRSQREENLSLLYVAMTRAKHELHLIVPPPTPTKTGSLSTAGLTDLSYASLLRATLIGPRGEAAEGGEVVWETQAAG